MGSSSELRAIATRLLEFAEEHDDVERGNGGATLERAAYSPAYLRVLAQSMYVCRRRRSRYFSTKLFGEVADITGIILTKIDGTAKGGVVIAITNEQSIPVKYLGCGEGIDNLQDFSAEQFAAALFDE